MHDTSGLSHMCPGTHGSNPFNATMVTGLKIIDLIFLPQPRNPLHIHKRNWSIWSSWANEICILILFNSFRRVERLYPLIYSSEIPQIWNLLLLNYRQSIQIASVQYCRKQQFDLCQCQYLLSMLPKSLEGTFVHILCFKLELVKTKIDGIMWFICKCSFAVLGSCNGLAPNS